MDYRRSRAHWPAPYTILRPLKLWKGQAQREGDGPRVHSGIDGESSNFAHCRTEMVSGATLMECGSFYLALGSLLTENLRSEEGMLGTQRLDLDPVLICSC